MQIEGFTPEPLPKAATSSAPSQAQDEAKLQEACKQFETLFLTQMFAQMRKSAGSSGLTGGGQSEEMFQGMLDEERAKNWSQEGGVGLANLLFQQMKQQNL
jgi:flagellar protein FlgJ